MGSLSESLARVALLGYFAAGTVLGLALLSSWIGLVGTRMLAGSRLPSSPSGAHTLRIPPSSVARGLVWLGFAALSLSVAARTAAAGRPPYANQYEFAVAFAWTVLAGYLLLPRERVVRGLTPAVLALALGLLLYASTLPSAITPPVPALQNRLLLGLHVGCALVAYGANAVAFVAALLFLAQRQVRVRSGWVRVLPDARLLDELGYGAVMVSFPMLGATLLLGSWWSSIAWGSYWSWDPKQSATLATWLVYAAYLHTRVNREWQGRGSALLLVLGFCATLLTFAGNLFFGGLHSYAGVTDA